MVTYIDSRPALSVDAPLFPVFKLTTLADCFRGQGIAPSVLLRGSGLNEQSLLRPATRVSYRQFSVAFSNAIRHGHPATAIEAGRRVHVTGSGLYGYALLSSPTALEACRFATEYLPILGPACSMTFSIKDRKAVWSFTPILSLDPNDPLYRFATEFQFAITYTMSRDVLGSQFRPLRMRAVYPRPSHSAVYADAFDSPIQFDQSSNDLEFDASLLDQPMVLGHEVTYAMVRELCDEQLALTGTIPGNAGRVRQILLLHPGKFVRIEEMASELRVSGRTLRRWLEAEGTTYNDVVSDVRKHLALKYLQQTAMTIEDIAGRLGYSDAASFRRAFYRWTGMLPTAYRSQGL